jgi:CheY-like chemotaxis protein/anti-sigma regulatory factor (Ser/Thr protein kinase)
LKPEKADIIQAFNKQYNLFIDLAENKKITYQFETTQSVLSANVDIVKLESIIQNLLSNAFKFTPNEGTIKFTVDFQNQSILKVQISDTGKGIDEESKPNIFQRFYQGNDSSSKVSGYGIGLNIAKEYCELMHGKISFESESEKGTSFTVEIPIEQLEDSNSFDVATLNSPVNIETKAIPLQANTAKYNLNLPLLLLVDDHPDTLKFLSINLKADYRIVTAANGIEAFKILEEKEIDLVISDIMMPELDGIGFCEKVKKHPKYQNIPLILLTAKTMESQKIEGYKAGSDAYITKPFDIEGLKARVVSLLSKNQKIDEYIKRQLIVENQEVEVESAEEKLLQECIQYINNHLTDPDINLEKMCKSIGVSHSSLYRKIKAQTGMTLNELIRNTKLKRAAQLIKTGKLTIAEIMSETGFTNHSYFAKCFKKVYNTSPREYGQN